MDLISENYEWIFSGIGVFVLGLVVSFIKIKKGKQTGRSMNQVSRDNCVNIQIGSSTNKSTEKQHHGSSTKIT